ncbi:MAG: hypothetical protein ACE5HZ_06355, partial [Fidelibacterota bacterium]
MTARVNLFFLFLPLCLAGQVLTKYTAPNTYLVERESIRTGEIDPYLSGRLSYEWGLALPAQSNDLLPSTMGDVWLRRDRLKIYPEITAVFYANGGRLAPRGPSVDVSPVINVAARYASLLLGRFELMFWGRFEKHSVVRQGNLSDLSYDLSWQKEVGRASFPGKDSTWAEYDIGDGGILFSYPGGQITLAKANPIWGSGYTGNVWLSNKPPSFVFGSVRHRFSERWVFSILHGTLNSGIRDSTHAGSLEVGNQRINFPLIRKYVAAHRLDFYPVPQARISLGESVIYGGRGREPQYFVPLVMYWSAQHDLLDTDNLQWFLDGELIRRGTGRLYGTVYLDEWDLMDTFNKEESRNWGAYQVGFTYNLPPFLPGESLLRMELTHMTPYVYVHENKVNWFQHHGHYLGFWSGPNSDNLFVAVEGIVKRGYWLQVYGQRTRRGEVSDETVAMQYTFQKIPFLYPNRDTPETR